MEPLAYLMRPKSFEEIAGQKHLVGQNGVIRKLVNNKKLCSLILYGKPGIGKTTIANVICNLANIEYSTFNASSDNKAKLTNLIDIAKMYDKYILVIDEIHRMKKDIQDYLLPFVENGQIIMIGITTVNPYMSVNPAIRSRCVVYKLNDLNTDDLLEVALRSIKKLSDISNKKINFSDDALKYICNMANGEVRILINYIEIIYNTYCDLDEINIDLQKASEIIMKPSVGIDKNEDSYYQTLSGLQKSIRGSDVDAALHYLAVLLTSEDLLSISRRLQIIAYEDIGLANPQLASRVRSACQTALDVGLPEAIIPLGVVVCDMALSPKSNSAYVGIHNAMEDIQKGKTGPLPPHLKNTYSFDGKVDSYKYPHDYPGSWVYQQYLPDNLINASYFQAKESGPYERSLKERYDLIKRLKQEYESKKGKK